MGAMVKRCAFVTKRRDLSDEQFAAYWKEHHADLASRLPGLISYRINVVESQCRDLIPYDGFSELWFADRQSMEHAFTELGRLIDEDEPNLFSSVQAVTVMETTIR